jgi:glutamate dehydrogenase
VYSIASQVTRALLSRQESLTDRQQNNQAAIAKLNQLLSTITTQGADLAPVSVALRELRQLA